MSGVAAFVVRKVVLLNRQELRRRISTVRFALCGRSGTNATFETLKSVCSKSEWIEVDGRLRSRWRDPPAVESLLERVRWMLPTASRGLR